MKIIGNEVYIQRGEIWSLDFSVVNEKGHPLILLDRWKNPYLVITIASSTYKQEGDYRKTYWLDLSKVYMQGSDESPVEMKKFKSTEPLYLEEFSKEALMDSYIDLALYENEAVKYLFYSDSNSDGNNVYKYIEKFVAGEPVWVEYNFRIVKQFTTNDLLGQSYLFDINILAGESLKEHIASLISPTDPEEFANDWSEKETRDKISEIGDEIDRARMLELFEKGAPLMPNNDVKSSILPPTKLYVSTNIQGGI